MASAIKKVTAEERITYVDVERVELILSVEEARFVRDLMGMVGGNQINSRRRHADSIIDALNSAGIYSSITDEYMNHEDVEGQSSIYFKDSK